MPGCWSTKPGARVAAEQLDRETTGGQPLGPLHGIPIGVKDLIDVAGCRQSPVLLWRQQAVADRDAPLVARLRQAGAIILGKTVTTQLAYLDPAPRATLGIWPHAGRIEQRLGRGRGERYVHGRRGDANRRLDPATGGLLRTGRLQTDLGQHPDCGHCPAQPEP